MTIETILNATLELRNGKKKKAGKINADKTIAQIWQEMIPDDAPLKDKQLLKKVLISMGLANKFTGCSSYDNILIDDDDAEMPVEKSVYNDILPLCLFAFKNSHIEGLAENYARKIALIFNDTKSVFNYLDKFKTQNDVKKNIFLDAFSFSLPDKEKCDFSQWKVIANQTDKMLNPNFRSIISKAVELEKILESSSNDSSDNLLNYEDLEFVDNGKEINVSYKNNPENIVTSIPYGTMRILRKSLKESDESRKMSHIDFIKNNKPNSIIKYCLINLKKIELSKTSKNLKNHTKIDPSQMTEKEKIEYQEKLINLRKEQYDKRLLLVDLCQGMDINNAFKDMVILEAFYEKYKSKSPAHKILVKHAISPKNIEQFYLLNRDNNNDIIPDITVKGDDIDYHGYYIKKLDIMSDEGAATAACLGQITNCCQYLGGVGNDVAVHGITSPTGGFYLLYDRSNQIIAQTWAWRGNDSATLCLDSIEVAVNNDYQNQKIIDMFRYFSHQILCNKSYGIKKINTGDRSGLTTIISTNQHPATHVLPEDYNGYRDSHAQLLLGKTDLPYLFYKEKGSRLFQEIIEDDTKRFIRTLLNVFNSLEDNDKLKTLISFAIYSEKNELIELIRQCLPSSLSEGKHRELDKIIQIHLQYYKDLNSIISLDNLNKGLYINALNSLRQSMLHRACYHPDDHIIQQLIAKGIDVNIRDENGNTALMIALEWSVYNNKCSHKEKSREIAKLLIDQGANTNIKDDLENTPLMIAVINNDYDMVKYLIEVGHADHSISDRYLRTPLFLAVEKNNSDIFNYLISSKAKVNIVNYKTNDSLLMQAIISGSPEIISTLLHHPDTPINHVNSLNKTASSLAIEIMEKSGNSDPLYQITKYKVEKNPNYLQSTEGKNSLLAMANKNSPYLLDIINLLDKKSFNDLLTTKSGEEYVSIILKRILSQKKLSKYGNLQEEIPSILNGNEKIKSYMIHFIEHNDNKKPFNEVCAAYLINKLSLVLSEEKIALFLDLSAQSNGIIWEDILLGSYSIESIFGALPTPSLLQLLQDPMLKNKLMDNPKALNILLKPFDEDTRNMVLDRVNQNNSFVIKMAQDNIGDFMSLLKLLSKEKQLELLDIDNNNNCLPLWELLTKNKGNISRMVSFFYGTNHDILFNKSILLFITEQPELFTYFLNLIPEKDRMIFITNDNWPILHSLATNNFSCFIGTLQLLKPQQREELLTPIDDVNNLLLWNIAFKNQSKLPEFIEILPFKLSALLNYPSVLNDTINNPRLFLTILENLPDDNDKVIALQLVNDESNNLFKSFINMNSSRDFERLLELLPKEQLKSFNYSEKNHDLWPLLIKKYGLNLKNICRDLPLNWKTMIQNNSFLDFLLKKDKAFFSVLHAIPIEERGEIIESIANLNNHLASMSKRKLINLINFIELTPIEIRKKIFNNFSILFSNDEDSMLKIYVSDSEGIECIRTIKSSEIPFFNIELLLDLFDIANKNRFISYLRNQPHFDLISFKQKPLLLKEILLSYTENERLETAKEFLTNSSHKDIIQDILEILPNHTTKLDFLNEKISDNNSLLSILTKDTNHLRKVFNCLSLTNLHFNLFTFLQTEINELTKQSTDCLRLDKHIEAFSILQQSLLDNNKNPLDIFSEWEAKYKKIVLSPPTRGVNLNPCLYTYQAFQKKLKSELLDNRDFLKTVLKDTRAFFSFLSLSSVDEQITIIQSIPNLDAHLASLVKENFNDFITFIELSPKEARNKLLSNFSIVYNKDNNIPLKLMVSQSGELTDIMLFNTDDLKDFRIGIFVDLFTEENKNLFINHLKNTSRLSPTHFKTNLSLLQKILISYPVNKRLETVKQYLYTDISDYILLAATLGTLSTNSEKLDFLTNIQTTCYSNYTIPYIYARRDNIDSFQSALELYPQEYRLNILTELQPVNTPDADSLLQKIITKPLFLQKAIELVAAPMAFLKALCNEKILDDSSLASLDTLLNAFSLTPTHLKLFFLIEHEITSLSSSLFDGNWRTNINKKINAFTELQQELLDNKQTPQSIFNQWCEKNQSIIKSNLSRLILFNPTSDFHQKCEKLLNDELATNEANRGDSSHLTNGI